MTLEQNTTEHSCNAVNIPGQSPLLEDYFDGEAVFHQQAQPERGVYNSLRPKERTLRLPSTRDAFEIAIICALPQEAAAIRALFEPSNTLDFRLPEAEGDRNAYSYGSIAGHNVVLVYLSGMGKVSAATAAADLGKSFGSIRLGLVVGICGAVPFPKRRQEIVLGDVIVSEGIKQFDFGRHYPDQFSPKDKVSEVLGRPNPKIRSFLQKMRSILDQHRVNSYVQDILALPDMNTFASPGRLRDYLYEKEYRHKHQVESSCEVCRVCTTRQHPVCKEARESLCKDLGCSSDRLIRRKRDDAISVHFGIIGCGDRVIRSAEDRDEIASTEEVIAFEMEGAGVWENTPTIVIKGVCDYADSHKDKMWQNYAAVTAAACAKVFLEQWATIDRGKTLSAKGAQKYDNESTLSSKRETEQPDHSSRLFSQHMVSLMPPLGRAHRKTGTSWVWGFAALVVSALAICLALAGAPKPSGSIQVPISQRRLLDARIPIYAVLGKTGVGKSSFIATLGGRHVRTGNAPDVDHSLESGTCEIGFYSFDSDITGLGYLADTPGIDATDPNLSNTQIMMMIRNQLQEVVNYDKLLMGLIVLWDVAPRKKDFGPLQQLNETIAMVDDLLGKNGVARITLVLTNFRTNPTYEEAEKEAQHEQFLRDLWQGPMACNSAIAKYDGKSETAQRIISDFNSRHRQRPWIAQDQQCQMFPVPQKSEKPVQEPNNGFKLIGSLIPALSGSTAQHRPILTWDILTTLLKTLWIASFQLLASFLITAVFRACLRRFQVRRFEIITVEVVLLVAILLLCPGFFCVGGIGTRGASTAEKVVSERPWKYKLPFQIWKFSTVPASVTLSWTILENNERRLVSLLVFAVTSLQVLAMWGGEWGAGWIHNFHPFSNISQAFALMMWLVQGLRFADQRVDVTLVQQSWVNTIWPLIVSSNTVLALYGPSQAAVLG